MIGRLVSLALIGGALTLAADARARPNDEAAAQALFDEALVLMDQHRYAEACPKLEASQRLDPAMGTKYRLAECFEAAGLTGTAWRLFDEVSADAKAAGRADREAQARERADALAPRVPWLLLRAPSELVALEGVEVRCDEAVMAISSLGQRLPVDPGAHTIVVSATGRTTQRKIVRSLEGATETVDLPMLEVAPVAPIRPQTPPTEPPPAPVPSPTGQRVAAVLVGSVGVIGVGLGIGFGWFAKTTWDDALAGCEGGAVDRCSNAAIADGRHAKAYSIVSTIGFVVGGAGLVTAPIVWATAPSSPKPAPKTTLVPAVGPRGGALFVAGEF
ncbi:MAG: hypothetical protein U0414_09005 [Polyangiaceae bacterium]